MYKRQELCSVVRFIVSHVFASPSQACLFFVCYVFRKYGKRFKTHAKVRKNRVCANCSSTPQFLLQHQLPQQAASATCGLTVYKNPFHQTTGTVRNLYSFRVFKSVSYTHLDVYKRQTLRSSSYSSTRAFTFLDI